MEPVRRWSGFPPAFYAASAASTGLFLLRRLQVQDIQKRIGATIRALRLKRGWSQDVFADRSGLNRAHVGEIERGDSNVTIQTLKIIADTLGVKIVDLRGL